VLNQGGENYFVQAALRNFGGWKDLGQLEFLSHGRNVDSTALNLTVGGHCLLQFLEWKCMERLSDTVAIFEATTLFVRMQGHRGLLVLLFLFHRDAFHQF